MTIVLNGVPACRNAVEDDVHPFHDLHVRLRWSTGTPCCFSSVLQSSSQLAAFCVIIITIFVACVLCIPQDSEGRVVDEGHPGAVSQRVPEAEVDKKGDGYVLKADPSVRVSARAHKMSKSRGNVRGCCHAVGSSMPVSVFSALTDLVV